MLVLWGWICFLLTNELLQFSLSNKGLDLLLQVIAIGRIVTMVTVEVAILILLDLLLGCPVLRFFGATVLPGRDFAW